MEDPTKERPATDESVDATNGREPSDSETKQPLNPDAKQQAKRNEKPAQDSNVGSGGDEFEEQETEEVPAKEHEHGKNAPSSQIASTRPGDGV